MRSGTPSAHQSAIVHSNSGHCRPAVTGLYLPPAPLNIIYIAPVSYDGEVGGVGGEIAGRAGGNIRAGNPAERLVFHFPHRGNGNISSWRNRRGKPVIASSVP